MIVNYYSSPKTRAPFCGLACCGNHFGRCDRSCYRHDSRMNRKILMRRYAKRAESNRIKREIENQIIEDYFWFDSEIESARIDYMLSLYNNDNDAISSFPNMMEYYNQFGY